MNHRSLIKNLGLVSMAVSILFIPSLLCSLFYWEFKMSGAFLSTMLCSFTTGLLLYVLSRRENTPLYHRETLALVGTGWLMTAFYGALPYLFSGELGLDSAYFESMSGFTTTGATVLTDIEALPKSLLFWRSFTNWLGGLGIILLLIIILPFLGAGGKLLYRSEMPGLDKESIRPKIKDSAIILLKLYLTLTFLLTALLWAAGMNGFDALCHTFSTLSTSGFSTKQDSIAAFSSPLIEAILIIFMVTCSTSFSLLYCVSTGDFKTLIKNSEFRFYIFLLMFFFILIGIDLHRAGFSRPFSFSLFQTASIMTTTGFVTTDIDSFPVFSQCISHAVMLVGGCSGSASGGLKVIRVLILFKLMYKHLEHAFRPKDIQVLRVGDLVITTEQQKSLLSFFVIYAFSTAVGVLYLSFLDIPIYNGFSATFSCINNIGVAFGVKSFATIPMSGKWLLSLLMAMGRLELYAICVLFIPSFWKRY